MLGEGNATDSIHVVLDGWCCRYRLLADGRRQLPALLLPGDICDLDALLLNRIHYGIAALTRSTVATVSRAYLRDLMDQSREIRDVLWWMLSVENSIAAEWAVGLGRRTAEERLAHLMCELLVRLSVVGHAHENSFKLPLTQQELGDALGVSTVHVNRTLQTLRGSGLIRQEGRDILVRNWDALKQLAGFSPDYLHIEGARLPHRASQ